MTQAVVQLGYLFLFLFVSISSVVASHSLSRSLTGFGNRSVAWVDGNTSRANQINGELLDMLE